MGSVVITGGTRGIGFALAAEFLRRGQSVALCGTSSAAAEAARGRLLAVAGGQERIIALACDVADLAAVQGLWDQAHERFGAVDVWINNAGQAHETHRFWEQPADRIEAGVRTNLIGVMNGCRVAMRGMLRQGYGAIYNMTGFGRTNLFRPGMAIYGTSKRGVDYFSKALAREVEGTGVIVGQINPGMVMTDMLRQGATSSVENPEAIRRIYSIMAITPEESAPFIVSKVLANRRNGMLINRQPRYMVLGKILAAPFRRKRRDIFEATAP